MKALAAPKIWTPKIAGKFCKVRINRIKRDLAEISVCYSDVDLLIEDTAMRLIGEIDDLSELIDEAVKRRPRNMTSITHQPCFGLVEMTPVIIKHTTERAALVDVGIDKPVWLPLAHAEFEPNPGGLTHTVSMPEWLAKDKGLI